MAAIGSIPGSDPRGGADRSGADAASLPHEAPVQGLLRAGDRDARQRRVPRRQRTGGAQEKAGTDSRTELGDHNHDLKNLFKGAAILATTKPGPFQEFYSALLAKGMRPEMARLTLARKIAAITLIVWKKGVRFEARYLKPQTA